MSLCQYKNIFGAPGQGAHRFRFMNIAIIDVIGLLLLAFATSYFFGVLFWYAVGGWFVIGIIAHRVFCVRTALDVLLFK